MGVLRNSFVIIYLMLNIFIVYVIFVFGFSFFFEGINCFGVK